MRAMTVSDAQGRVGRHRLSRLPRWRIIVISFAISSVVLAATYAVRAVLRSAPPLPALVNGWRAPTTARLQIGSLAKSNASYEETLSRPIFSRSRRPQNLEETGELQADNALSEPEFSVAAVVQYNGIRRVFVIGGDAPEGAWRSAGEKIEGWTISEVTRSDLELTGGGKVKRVGLYPWGPPSAARSVEVFVRHEAKATTGERDCRKRSKRSRRTCRDVQFPGTRAKSRQQDFSMM
jgi:hypothetical protein